MSLWTPEADIPQRAVIPDGHLRLRDGRRLRFIQRVVLRDPSGNTPDMEGAWWLTSDGLKVLATMDDTPHGELLHVSISRADRYPSWEEIKVIRDAFYPETADAVMILPRKTLWVDEHPNCFHLIQCPVDWGLM